MAKTPASTGKKQGRCPPVEHQFKPGQSGNPAGRAPGSRNKVTEAFIQDLCEVWDKHGAAALETAAKEQPAQFARMVASLLPSEQKITNEPPKTVKEMTDAELLACIASTEAKIEHLIGPEKAKVLSAAIDANLAKQAKHSSRLDDVERGPSKADVERQLPADTQRYLYDLANRRAR